MVFSALKVPLLVIVPALIKDPPFAKVNVAPEFIVRLLQSA